MTIEQVNQLAKDLRLRALKMAFESGKNGSHIGGALSAIEIFATLYGSVLNYDKKRPDFENRDRLIVSKGHCVLAYYAALQYAGFLSESDLQSFEQPGTSFHGHAVRNVDKGIEFSGGSLSMGMSFAVGVALGCKKKKLDCNVYVIVGDGECDEGLIWESAMSASNFHLDNFTLIVDCNKLQYDGFTSDVMNNSPLSDKFRAFGFDVSEVDGHSCDQLYKAFKLSSSNPKCIIANTIKGKGVSFMENKKEWHHAILSEELYNKAKEEVSSCQI